MNRLRQRHAWQDLGRALKTLRSGSDLGQKTVIERSGEEIGERTLRGYESGEQRPSRDRLLRLLVRSFELKNAAEINGHLKLGKYAPLTETEVRQFGLNTVRTGVTVPVSGPPADFRAEVSTLVITDGQGREVWRHEFPSRFSQDAYERQNAFKRCVFADLDGDGNLETLFVYVPFDFGSVGTTLICFSENGAIRWQFVPGKTMREDTGREYYPPYFISNVRVIAIPSFPPRILVSSNHYLHNPNQVAMLGADGNIISEYWHSGHLLSVAHADINNDGIEELLLAGVNNGYGQATMLIFDPRNVNGVSTQPGRQLLGCDPGTEKAVILFPRTCVVANAPYNRVLELRITPERRIMLAVVEGVSEARNPGVMIYELDFDLNVRNARPDSHLREAHRVLEAEGILDHSWTEEESHRLRSEVTLKGRL